MLEYDRTYVSVGFHVSKTNVSLEVIICYYWYFSKINFRFQANVYVGVMI